MSKPDPYREWTALAHAGGVKTIDRMKRGVTERRNRWGKYGERKTISYTRHSIGNTMTEVGTSPTKKIVPEIHTTSAGRKPV